MDILPRRITVAFLQKHAACDSQVAHFARVFPKGATVTEANLVKASSAMLNLDWLIYSVLGDKVCNEHDSKVADLTGRFGPSRMIEESHKLERETIYACRAVR